MLGASKPVSHMSRTITSLSGSFGSRARLARRSRRALLPMCCCQSCGSLAAPVITILTEPFSLSRLCQSGRSLMISLYRFTQIRRLMQTTMALPSKAATRSSKWVTISFATRARRLSLPTNASTVDHFLFSRSCSSSGEFSVSSSTSASIFGLSSSSSSIRANRDS